MSMEVSTACEASLFELKTRHFDLKQPYANNKQCSGSVNHSSDSLVSELGNTLTEILDVQDVHLQLSGQILSSDGDDICHREKDVSIKEFKAQQTKGLNAPTQKSLQKSEIFPCSRKGPSCTLSIHESDEVPATSLPGESSTKSKNPVCTRSISLPTPSKLVSALKGSREKRGMFLQNLNVTWAPDVYDPPATSVSHSVKSCNQQRSRNKKKNSKHKHKGRSSRGSNSEKQYRKHVGSTDFGSQSLSTCGRIPPGEYNQSTVELEDLAVSGQDSNCGSSFLRTSLAKVHISVAEAT